MILVLLLVVCVVVGGLSVAFVVFARSCGGLVVFEFGGVVKAHQ